MGLARYTKRPLALGSFNVGPKAYGHMPGVPRQRAGLAHTPAIGGLFRRGRIVPGISQINAMATNVRRGSGS